MIMMNNYKLVLLVLVLYYFFLNLYLYNTKSLYNIGTFIVLFFIINIFLKDKINSIISAYILCILWNIKTKFHLLENFENKEDIYENKLESLSERLINKYINTTKKIKPQLISTRKIKTTDLLPIKSELCPKKIKLMMENSKILKKPIVITNDNFIIDGHYRWYINKNNDKKFITVIIVSTNIDKFLKNINKFKKEHNTDELDKIKLDKDKIDNAKHSIKLIMDNIKKLNEYQTDLDKINVV
jgi:hypothetical protein